MELQNFCLQSPEVCLYLLHALGAPRYNVLAILATLPGPSSTYFPSKIAFPVLMYFEKRLDGHSHVDILGRGK